MKVSPYICLKMMSECLQILPRNWRNGASNLILDIILVRFTHERWFAMLTKDGCAVAPRIVVFDEIWFALLTNALREGLINKVNSFTRQRRLFQTFKVSRFQCSGECRSSSD